MAFFFLSDVHLRGDRPDRGERLACFVENLHRDDALLIAGDLCDFWFASREAQIDPMRCLGLRALGAFRERGGSIRLLVGNHDAWLGPFYQKAFGADLVDEPFECQIFGLRVAVAHGHRLGARRFWKAAMESERFLKFFAGLPEVVARKLDRLLDAANERGRAESDRRHLLVYRTFADSLADRTDLVVLGHIHTPFDDRSTKPRMIVLGGWHQASPYLKVDEEGVKTSFPSSPV